MPSPPLTCLVVGHRATGKTTLGRALAQARPCWSVLDLDESITQTTGRTPAQLIADSLARFRAIESQTLATLVAQARAPVTVIVVGAGCMQLPQGALVLWLQRDGWEDTAGAQREQVRPELSLEQEHHWMRAHREPVWAAHAHVRVRIEPGDPPMAARDDAARWIEWAAAARHTPHAKRSYFVPTTPLELERAEADARLLGMAGVEARSDFFDAETLAARAPGCRLLSLRHDDPSWLLDASQRQPQPYDIDITHLEQVLTQGVLGKLSATCVLLSHHAPEHDPSHLERLVQAYKRCIRTHPELEPVLGIKYAPKIETWAQLEAFVHDTHAHPLRHRMTLLPQGHQWGWIRPWMLAKGNLTNYIPVGIAAAHAPSPWDLQTWLPHLTTHPVEAFDALVGAPVSQSIGDAWHRHASLKEQDLARTYIKVPLPTDLDAQGFAQALTTLAEVGVRGVSVTSPFKRLVPQVARATSEVMEAANTLTLSPAPWVYTDTDADGLRASLAHLESQGIGPGTIAMIGRGGVSPAMRRGLEGSGWQLTHHASARQGWGLDAPEEVTLVINACGDRDAAYRGAPQSLAWLDLHYTQVRTPPGDRLHLNGRRFFDAQARAQRAFWASPSPHST